MRTCITHTHTHARTHHTQVSLRSGWNDATASPINTLTDAEQATWLRDLYKLWFSYPQIKGVWLWGW